MPSPLPETPLSSDNTPATSAPVTTRWLDPQTEWQPRPGIRPSLPHFIIEHYSHPADLRVTLLNYGERQPGAEDVFLYLNRPVLGQERFSSTNGDAAFSKSGAYLLITTPFLLIAIDAHSLQAWHYALPNRTMLLSAGWVGEQIRGQMLAYGQPSRAAKSLGPWSWADVTQRWQAGLGQAAQGNNQ